MFCIPNIHIFNIYLKLTLYYFNFVGILLNCLLYTYYKYYKLKKYIYINSALRINMENNLVKLIDNITCIHTYNVIIYNVEG